MSGTGRIEGRLLPENGSDVVFRNRYVKTYISMTLRVLSGATKKFYFSIKRSCCYNKGIVLIVTVPANSRDNSNRSYAK